jgi:hypothetical protein
MMKAVLRVAVLFAGYSTIGFGGDYAVGLLAQDYADDVIEVHAPEVVVEVERHVVVDVKPTIVSRVQVRHNGECAFEVDRELTIPVSAGNDLSISAGSGSLHVEGQEGLEEVVVVGMVCASHEEYLDELLISVQEASNGEVQLRTHYPENRSARNNKAQINLTVLVPFGMNVAIEDSSGEIDASGTGDLSIDDSSGSIQVHGIVGSLHIDDSSGGIDVQDISGDVSIEDGSGGLEIQGVQGSLTLRDGSGGIEITDVGQDVTIESDGSGGIEVRNVGGDFVVDRDGSGGIRHSGVEGRVEIPVRRRRGS